MYLEIVLMPQLKIWQRKISYPLGEGHPLLAKLPQERTIYTFCKSMIIKFQVYYHANVSISPLTPPNPLLSP